MNTHDLFDRMATELAGLGAVEDSGAATRTLLVEGVPFARLLEDGAEVYLPEGSPARENALERGATSVAGQGWIHVPDTDVASWPPLFEQALQGLRR